MAKMFNLEDVRIPDDQLEQFLRNQKAPEVPERKVAGRIGHGRAKRTEPFVLVPLWWAERANKAGRNINMPVCIDLLYRAWKADGKPFKLPNIEGVSRWAKNRTLRALERAGLIFIKWRTRKSPIVTLAIPLSSKQTGA